MVKEKNEEQNKGQPPETVEALAARLEVSAPVFAAVMQMQGWSSGKTVSEEELKKAVEAAVHKQNKGQPPETVEELAARLEVSAPVFAAVMQMQGWSSGKTVPEVEFKKVVEAFLGAPISGVKPPEGEKK